MPTAHRPKKEYGKQPQQLLERFITAIDNENLPKVRALLREIEKSPPEGLWMHSALATALKVRADNQIEFVNCLLESRLAPKDTKEADFIITGIVDGARPEVMKALLGAGFCPRTKGCTFLFDLVERGGVSNIDTDWIHAHHLHNAKAPQLIKACAAAVWQQDTPNHWTKTLGAVPPDPIFTDKITRRTVGLAPYNEKMPTIKMLKWAEKNHWFCFAEAAKECEKLQTMYQTSKGNYLDRLGVFMSHLEGVKIECNTQPAPGRSPHKRRL